MLEFSDNKATRGSISQIIITALSSGDKYGYEICKEIERLSNGVLVLKQPSLYSSLRRMEEQNLISSYWQDSDIGGKRHYYSLTEKGREIYEENKDSLDMNELINNLPLSELDLEDFQPNSNNFESNKSTAVASQENLFNLVNKTNEIKLIKEDDNDNENKSFVQFDLFDQKVNFIKDNSKNTDKVNLYSNKYENLDKHEEEIEPDKTAELDQEIKLDQEIRQKDHLDNQVIEPITRSSLFGNHDNSSIQDDRSDIISEGPPSDSQKIEDEANNHNYEVDDENATTINEVEIVEDEVKYDPEKIKWNNISTYDQDDEDLKQKSNDYKSIIGQLYSDSKLPDPYEENKFYTFKEIFPTAQVKEQHKDKIKTTGIIDAFVNEKNNVNSNLDNLTTLSEQFNSQGLKIKIHNNDNNKNNLRLYSDINKLNMTTSWYVSIIMMLEIVLSYVILDNYDYVISKQSLMFFLGGSIAISLLIVATLENLFDRFKLIIIKRQFKRDFVKAFLLFIFICVLTFAICLISGMQSLGQIEYLSYWLVPILVASNIITYCIIFHSLLKSKHYNN